MRLGMAQWGGSLTGLPETEAAPDAYAPDAYAVEQFANGQYAEGYADQPARDCRTLLLVGLDVGGRPVSLHGFACRTSRRLSFP